MSCEHEHHSHSHNHNDGDDHIAPIPTNQSQSLREFIDFDKLTGLNIKQENQDLRKVFKEQDDKYSLKGYIESDSDSQFILNIPFTGNVKLYSIILRTHGDANHCPKTVKLFKNKNDLDFDNVNSSKPTFKFDQPQLGPLILEDEEEEVEVDNDDTTFVEHYLPRNQFQSTRQLTIFVENNWEDDEDELTKVYYIELRGIFTSPITKNPIITLYESAANPADHENIMASEIGNRSNI